jgi:hypothetical protein
MLSYRGWATSLPLIDRWVSPPVKIRVGAIMRWSVIGSLWPSVVVVRFRHGRHRLPSAAASLSPARADARVVRPSYARGRRFPGAPPHLVGVLL